VDLAAAPDRAADDRQPYEGGATAPVDHRLPILVVGDVHGDLERLFAALKPYPADAWHTVFLGDLVDGGPFGVGALRYARDRPNSTTLLGNHEVMMLWALRDRSRLPYWLGIGGELHDLAELAKDEELQGWVKQRPLLYKAGDTLFQHSDSDLYARLLDTDDPDPIASINAAGAELLKNGGEGQLWDVLSPGQLFRRSRNRLEAWLRLHGATRLVHGHKPHARHAPDAYHDALAVDFDGGLSRFRPGARYRKTTPLAASVAPLESPQSWSRS
jgi:serine/threonine protein phosphatase 1